MWSNMHHLVCKLLEVEQIELEPQYSLYLVLRYIFYTPKKGVAKLLVGGSTCGPIISQ